MRHAWLSPGRFQAGIEYGQDEEICITWYIYIYEKREIRETESKRCQSASVSILVIILEVRLVHTKTQCKKISRCPEDPILTGSQTLTKREFRKPKEQATKTQCKERSIPGMPRYTPDKTQQKDQQTSRYKKKIDDDNETAVESIGRVKWFRLWRWLFGDFSAY